MLLSPRLGLISVHENCPILSMWCRQLGNWILLSERTVVWDLLNLRGSCQCAPLQWQNFLRQCVSTIPSWDTFCFNWVSPNASSSLFCRNSWIVLFRCNFFILMRTVKIVCLICYPTFQQGPIGGNVVSTVGPIEWSTLNVEPRPMCAREWMHPLTVSHMGPRSLRSALLLT